MWRNASGAGFRWPRSSLRVKLVAVLLCLLAAGAAVIVTAGASTLRGQLIRQAGTQLRAYANELTSHPFQVLGTAQGAPVGAAPFNATGARAPGTAGTFGSPGAARMAGETSSAISAATAGPVVAGINGIGGFSIELSGPSGQLLLSAGPGIRPGQPVPVLFARAPARTGVLRTVQAPGGDYLVIAKPVHVRTRRLAYGDGADDFMVTSRGRTGQAGTLVVGLRLAGIGHTVGRLTWLAVAVNAAAILIAGGLAWAAIRFSLRPVTRAARAADALAASGLSSGMPEWPAGALAGSLHSTLSELGARFTGSAAAEQAARSATDQLSQDMVAAAESLRRPVSLLHGVAEHWTHHDRRGAADADRALDQVAAEAGRIEALLDQLDRTRRDPAVSRDPE